MGTSSGKLDQKYYVSKVQLGRGSFGTVFRGTEKNTEEVVAIKIMNRRELKDRAVKEEHIKKEISVMRALSKSKEGHVCENIVLLKDVFQSTDKISLVLEYCPNGDFGDKLSERSSSWQRSIKETEAAAWMQQVCSAIQALHQREICHRDIKPDNFLISAGVLKLADFGLATFVAAGTLLKDRCGTPAFLAPEMWKITNGYSYPVDMWSAGIIMHMLLARGRHPFVDSDKKVLEKSLLKGDVTFSHGFLGDMFLPKFSEPAYELCRRMLEPDATRRLSADAVLSDPWMVHASYHRAPVKDMDPRTWISRGEVIDGQGDADTEPAPGSALSVANNVVAYATSLWAGFVGEAEPTADAAGPQHLQAIPEDDDECRSINTRITGLRLEHDGLIGQSQAEVENTQLREQLAEVKKQLAKEQEALAKAKSRKLPRIPKPRLSAKRKASLKEKAVALKEKMPC